MRLTSLRHHHHNHLGRNNYHQVVMWMSPSVYFRGPVGGGYNHPVSWLIICRVCKWGGRTLRVVKEVTRKSYKLITWVFTDFGLNPNLLLVLPQRTSNYICTLGKGKGSKVENEGEMGRVSSSALPCHSSCCSWTMDGVLALALSR